MSHPTFSNQLRKGHVASNLLDRVSRALETIPPPLTHEANVQILRCPGLRFTIYFKSERNRKHISGAKMRFRKKS